MALKDFTSGLIGSLTGRLKRPVDDLVQKVKASSLKVPKINLREPLQGVVESQIRLPGERIRKAGEGISQFGEGLNPTPQQLKTQLPFVSLTKQSLSIPISFAGQTIRGFGSAAERLAKPKETLQVLKSAPVTKGLDIFGTFEQPTKIGIATDIFGAGFDVSDLAKGGLIALVAGGTREAPGELRKLQSGIDVLDDIQTGFKAGKKAKTASKFGVSLDVARRDLLDRLTPIFDLTEKAGKDLPSTKNPYYAMRLIAGMGGKVEATLEQGLAPVLRREASRLDDLSSLLILERSQELASNGKVTRYSLDQMQQGVEALRLKHGAGFDTLQQSAQEVRNYANSLLDMLRQSGIIDDVSFKAIKAKNELYIPFQIIDYISDGAEKNRFARTSFNVAKQDVLKSIKGSEKALGDPLEALVERTGKVISLTERNNALTSLINLRKEIPEVFSELIKPVGKRIDDGFDTINLFENGKNVKYQVPQAIADSIKNINQQSANILTEILRPQATLLRLGATGLNLPFILTNPIRDFSDAMFGEITEKGVKQATEVLASYPAAIASILKKDDLYQQWALAGGRQATFTSQIIGQPTATIKQLAGTESGLKKINPINLIKFFNGIAEESTRLARFRAGVRRGENVTEAAFRSRDITVDFAKSGDRLKQLNQVIPFINASVQGVERMFRITKNNPARAAAAIGILSAFPAFLTYSWNRQFKDYKDIPQWEKDQSWIFLARDRTELEKIEGEPIKGIKIPKGRIAGIPANITEAFLQFLEDKDPSALGSLTGRVLTDISPIGLPISKQGFLRTMSNVTPPIFKGGLEVATNTSFFTGLPIVPERLKGVAAGEQYRETTPESLKALGKLGISPLKAQQFLQSTTGGLGLTIADVLSGKSPLKGVERRFTNIRSGAEVDKMFDEVVGISTASKTETLKQQREAEKVIAEMKTLQPQEASQVLQKAIKDNPAIFKRLVQISEDEALGLTALDRSVKALPVQDGSRAKFVFSRLNEAENPQEQQKLISEYVKKKIITNEVGQQINILFKLQEKSQQEVESQRTSFVKDRPKNVSEQQANALFSEVKNAIAKVNPFNPPEISAAEFSDLFPTDVTEVTKEGSTTRQEPAKLTLGQYLKEKFDEIKKGIKDAFNKDAFNNDTVILTNPNPEKFEPVAPDENTPVDLPDDKFEDLPEPPPHLPGPTPTPPVTKYDDTIGEVWGELSDDARRLLKRTLQDGRTHGENTALDPSLDFSGNANGSTDRGLFQINSNTFDDIKRRYPKSVEAIGVKTFDDLKDVTKNIKFAKLIFDDRESWGDWSSGWDAWVASPANLLSEAEKTRRRKNGTQILE